MGVKEKKDWDDSEVLYGFIIIILLTPIFPGLFSRVHTWNQIFNKDENYH